jgi:transposase InsO family protein
MPWQKAFASAIRFKNLKSELVYQQDFQTQAKAKQAVFEYIEIWRPPQRYNRRRRHSALDYLSPFDYYNRQFQQVA